MSEPTVSTTTDLIAAMRSSFEELVTKTVADAKGDLKAYGQQLAQEFGRYLWRSLKEKDQRAAENLRDLKVQVLLIASKRSIVVAHDTMDRLKEAVEIAARFAVKTLLAAVVML